MQRIMAMVRGGRAARWASAAAALLLTLCAVVGTFTPVDAQLGSADEDTTPVYLLARVQRLQAGDARGSYLIEFGVLPASMVDGAGGAPAAAAANARFLPERRYLSESMIRGRARAGDRRWLRSSLIRIVLPGGGGRVLEARVIARWNPKAGGPLRIEFGFLLERARTAAGGDTQTAARTHAVLPKFRYLSQNTIAGELGRSRPRWFRSTPPVDVPLSSGGSEALQPTVAWSGYAPSDIEFGVSAPRLLPPTATVNGVAVQLQYRYRVALPSVGVCSVDGQGALTILGIGDCRVQATSTATARYRSATASASVRVSEVPQEDPRLRWAGYSPASARVGDPARAPLPPTAAHPSIEFRYRSRTPANCRADPTSGALAFLAAGSCSVTVSTVPGENYRAAEVTVTVNITEGGVTPVVSWGGYQKTSVTVGEPPTSPTPPRATVSGAVVNLRYKYSTASAGVCRVDENVGLLTPLGEGVCVVTATSITTSRYLPATAMARVTVGPRPVAPMLRWAGYSPGKVRLGQPAPSLQQPIATVDGTAVSLTYSYSVAPQSRSVCGIDENNGRLNITGVGLCSVAVVSEATGKYLSSQATALVEVENIPLVRPSITWAGYSPRLVELGQSTPTLQRPTATVDGAPVNLTYSYSVAPLSSSVCRIHADTGQITITGIGVCGVIVVSRATERYLPSQAMASVTVTPPPQNQAPVVRPAWEIPPLPQQVMVGCGGRPPASVTVGPSGYFSDPDGDPLTYRLKGSRGQETRSVQNNVLEASIDDWLPSLMLRGRSVGSTTITLTARDPGGLSAETAIPITVEACPGQSGGGSGSGTSGPNTDDDDDTGVVDGPGGRGATPPGVGTNKLRRSGS